MESLSQSRAGTPVIRVEVAETQSMNDDDSKASAKSLPGEARNIGNTEPPRPSSADAVEFPNLRSMSSSSTPPSPSTSSPLRPSPSSQLSPLPRKGSTFRRLTPKTSAPSSPLANRHQRLQDPSTHNRSVSTASLPAPSTEAQRTSTNSTTTLTQDRSRTASNPSIPSSTPRPAEKQLPATPTVVAAPLEEICPSLSQTSGMSRTTSQSSSPPNGSSSTNRSGATSPYHKFKSAPYPKGFQPKGATRHLTDNFLALRRLKRDGQGDEGRVMRIEKAKLERRLEKLINLHFPVPGSTEEKEQQLREKSSPNKSLNRRASSFFDFESIKTKKLSDATDLWRGVVTGNQDKARDIRGNAPRNCFITFTENTHSL